MAISESLLIDVKVRKDGSIKQASVNVSAFEETINSLKKQMKLLTNSTNQLSQENKALAKTFEDSNGSIKNSAKLYEEVSSSVLIAASAIEKLSGAISFLFNDKNRDMLINVLRILSSIAEMKGMTSASNSINKLKQSVIELDAVFDQYHINNMENLEKTANKLEEQILIYKILMGTALVASVSAATLTIGVFLTAVAQTIAGLEDFQYAVYRVRNIYLRLDDILRRPEGMQIIRNEIYKTIATYDLMARIVLVRFGKKFTEAMGEVSDASVKTARIITNSILLGVAKSLTSAENTIKSFKSIYVDGIALIGTEVQKEFKKGFSFSAYIKSAIGEVRSEYASMLMNIQVANIGVVRSFEKWSSSAIEFATVFAKVMTATFLNASAMGLAQTGIFEFFKYAPIFLKSFASSLAILFVQFKNGIDLSAYLSVSLRNLGISFLHMSIFIINAIAPIQAAIVNVLAGSTIGAVLSLTKYFDLLRASFTILLRDTVQLSKSFMDLAGSVGQLVAHVAKLGINDLVGFFTKLGAVVQHVSTKMLDSIVNMFISISGSLSNSVSNTTQFFKNLYDSVLSMSSSFVSGLMKSFADIGNKSFAMFSNIGQNIGAFGSSVNNTFVNIMAKTVQEVFKNAEFLVKAGTILANPLLLIGQAAILSESSLIKFAGTTAIVAAILMGGFSTAIVYSLGAIGSLTEKIGTALMGAMESMEQKFTKAQATLSAFSFVVKGYGKTIGEDAVGSLEMWNDAIQKIISSTTFSTEEVSKATKILIAEGSALGLSAAQNLDLLNRSVDISTAQGRDLADVSVAVASGLMGQSQSVLSLGINLKEAHLEHSKFLLTQNKLMDDLTESEKIQLRYNELMKQTAPIIGAATNELQTISGATKKVDQLFESLQIRIGSMGSVTSTFILIQQKLLSGLLQLPSAFYDLFGIMIDVVGVFLKISGVIIKYTVLATGLIFTYKALVWFTTQNAIAQGVLTTVMNILGRSVMVQTAAVTSLSVAWSNFLLIAKGGLVLIFRTIIGLVGQLTYALVAFGAALLANPMTWVIAGVTAVLYNFLNAANDIRKELSFLRDAFGFTGTSFKELGDTFNAIINVIKIGWGLLYSSSKVALLGIIETVLLVQIAVMKLKAVFASSKEEQDAYNLAVDELTVRLRETDSAVVRTANTMGEAFGGMSLSAKTVGESIKDVSEQTQIYALRAKKLVDVISEISQEAIKIGILGTEFEKASEAIKLNKSELDKLTLSYVESGAKNKEALDEIKTKTEELWRSEFELQRLRTSTLDDFTQKSRQLEIDRLRSSGNVVQAIKMEYEAQRQAIDAQVEGLKLTGVLTDEQIIKVNSLKSALNEAEKASKLQELRNQAKQQNKNIEDIKKGNIELQHQIESDKLGEIELIDKILAKNLDALDDIREKNKLEGTYTKELEDQLQLGAKLKKQKAEQDKEKIGKVDIIPKSTIEALRVGVGEGAANFAAGISDGLASFAGGVGAIMGAVNGVLDFAQQLIDFIPNVLSKIGNIFNSLTDLPLKIMEGIKNVFASIGNLVRNLIPNIITSVEGILDSIVAAVLDLPKMVRDLLEKIPGMLIKLLNRLPEIAENLVMGLISAMPEIVSAFIEFFILRAPEIAIKMVEVIAFRLPTAIVNGIARGLKKVFGSFVNTIGKIFGFSVPDEAKNLGKDIADGAKKAVRDISRETSQIFSVKNLEEAAKGLQENEKIQEALNQTKSFWQYLMDRLNALVMFFAESWDRFVSALDQVWKGVVLALQMAWGMIKTIFDGIVKAIKDAFNWGSEAIKKSADYFYEMGGKIWDGFKDAITKGMSFITDIGAKIADGLKDALAKLDPGNLLAKMFKLDGGGTEKVEKALGIDVPFVAFAKGGLVPGNAPISGDSSINDRILALLSPGEYVIPRSAMDQPGIRDLVEAVSSGQYSPKKYAIGGYVGGRIAAVQSGGVSGAANQAKDLGAKIKSGGAQAWTDIQNAGQDVLDQLAQLDPSQLWKMVEGKVWDGIWAMISGSAPNFHTGGLVPAFANGGDVMATLQPGEFVMQRSAVQQNGLGLMNKINNGQATSSNQTYNFDVNLQIDASAQSLDETYIRNKLIPSIKSELKKSSLRGEFVLSDRGLR